MFAHALIFNSGLCILNRKLAICHPSSDFLSSFGILAPEEISKVAESWKRTGIRILLLPFMQRDLKHDLRTDLWNSEISDHKLPVVWRRKKHYRTRNYRTPTEIFMWSLAISTPCGDSGNLGYHSIDSILLPCHLSFSWLQLGFRFLTRVQILLKAHNLQDIDNVDSAPYWIYIIFKISGISSSPLSVCLLTNCSASVSCLVCLGMLVQNHVS